MQTFAIRRYQPGDLEALQTLDAQVVPYRPEDLADAEAMYVRARAVENDPQRWAPIPAPVPGRQSAQPRYLALWVAQQQGPDPSAPLVGMCGVGQVNFRILPSQMPFALQLRGRNDVVELQHLRIHPDFHRQGLGERLSRTVIDWAIAHGCRSLLLNTTVPQHPARLLYQKLGFQEVARSFVGKYELIWMEMQLP